MNLRTSSIAAVLLATLTAHAAPASPDPVVGTWSTGPDATIWIEPDGDHYLLQVGLHPCAPLAAKDRGRACPIPASRRDALPQLELERSPDGRLSIPPFDAQVTVSRQAGHVQLRLVQHLDHAVVPGDHRTTLPLRRVSSAVVRPAPPPELPMDDARLQPYVGVYRLSADTDMKVTIQAGHLQLRATEGGPALLYPWAPDRFRMRLDPGDLHFVRDAAGRVTALESFGIGGLESAARQGDGYVARMPPNLEPKHCPVDAPDAPPDVERGHYVAGPVVHSERLHDDLPLCAYLPRGYDASGKTYPVLYAMDGQFIEPLVAELEKQRRAFVIVGVGNFERRELDDLPPGDARFFDALVHEVLPEAESTWRIDPSQRALYGHSLAGLFTANAVLLDDPVHPAFPRVLSSDGSFWAGGDTWHARILQRRARSARLPVTLYMAGAGHGNAGAAAGFVEQLRHAGFSDLELTWDDDPSQNHNSVASAAVAKALPMFFPGRPSPHGSQAVALVDAGPAAGTTPMPGAPDGFHDAELPSSASTFRVSIGGETRWGVATGTPALAQGQPQALVRDGAPIAVAPAGNEPVAVRLQAADNGSPVVAWSTKRTLFGSHLAYVRGSMNAWGRSGPLVRSDGGRWSTELTLPAGDYEFKIGSDDFLTIDFGAPPSKPGLAVGTPMTLVHGGANIALHVPRDGVYCFSVDARDEGAPAVVVEVQP